MRRVLLAGLLALAAIAIGACASNSPGGQIFAAGIGHNGPVPRSIDGGPYVTSGRACANCHGTNGRGGIAPAIDRASLGTTRQVLHAGLRRPVTEGPWTPEQTVEVARTGKTPEGVTLGPRMPRWQLDTQDGTALAQYLGTL